MAYNSESYDTQRTSWDQQGKTSNIFPWQNAPFPQSVVADPYAGSPYTGNDTYTPEAADPAEYWNKETAGYDQMPDYNAATSREPYNVAQMYQPAYIDPSQTNWENANTYAPWSHPQSAGGVESGNQQELMQDPSFWAGGGHPGGTINNMQTPGEMVLGSDVGNTFDSYTVHGGFGFKPIMGGDTFQQGIGDIFGRKKKRQHLTYEQPSYQGYMFTPQEGFQEYYNPSQETQNQTQADIYTQQSTQPEIAGTASYDYNYGGVSPETQQTPSYQSYVGQQDQNYGSLYGGSTGQSSLYDTFKPGEFQG